MKVIGDEMLNSGQVISPAFSDNAIKFNRLKVNSISDIDLQTVNKNVIITTSDNNEIYYYNEASKAWLDWSLEFIVQTRITLNSITPQFNYIHFLNDVDRYFEIDNSILSGLSNNSTFVIDWWMLQYDANTNGCLMYNGSTLSPDPINEQQLCISTSGDIIDPETLETELHPENDGFLNILYPPLKSDLPINNNLWHHCALVSKDGVVQLVIDAKVTDETQFDGIIAVDNLLVGSGYGSGIEAYIGKIRVTKNDDLGWFDGGFDLPINEYVADGNTEFMMVDSTSLVDVTLNHTVIVHGTPLDIYPENHYVYIQPSYQHSLIKLDFASETDVYLPTGINGKSLQLENINETVNLQVEPYGDKYLKFYSVIKKVILLHIDGWRSYDETLGKVRDSEYLDNLLSPHKYYYSSISGKFNRYARSINSFVDPGWSEKEHYSQDVPTLDTIKVLRPISTTGISGMDSSTTLTFYMRHISASSYAYTVCSNGSNEYVRVLEISGDSVRFTIRYYSNGSSRDYNTGWINVGMLSHRWFRVSIFYWWHYVQGDSNPFERQFTFKVRYGTNFASNYSYTRQFTGYLDGKTTGANQQNQFVANSYCEIGDVYITTY